MKDLIYSNQDTLFGKREIIGFGDDHFQVKEIDRDLANDLIKKNHYSGKIYNGTYIHLGVYLMGKLVGVLQYGYAMNPASASSVVKDTAMNEYLELNRMWLADEAERNSESKAISYSIKYIRSKHRAIKWIQSFADERCGCFGIVYQAANFCYYGEHNSIFWELDGVVYHNSLMTRNPNLTKASKFLQENKDRANKYTLRQFRYLYFLNKRCKSNCLLKEIDYPKHYKR
jgi:hypothetical protein